VITYIEERAGTEFEPDAATAFVAMMRKAEGGIQLSPIPAPAANLAAPAVNDSPDSAPVTLSQGPQKSESTP
jgi:hypothetical protein